jgi:hypothetical protein
VPWLEPFPGRGDETRIYMTPARIQQLLADA